MHFEFNNTAQKPQYITMAPGQKLIYYSQSGKTELYTTSGEGELAWKDGIIVFKQTSLQDALEILTDMMWNLSFDAMCPMMTCSPGHSRAGAWSRY